MLRYSNVIGGKGHGQLRFCDVIRASDEQLIHSDVIKAGGGRLRYCYVIGGKCDGRLKS